MTFRASSFELSPPAWDTTACTLCGSSDANPLFRIPHPHAPDGESMIQECVSCGLRRLDPRPYQQSLGQYYPSDYHAYVGRQRGKTKQVVWNFLRDVSSGAPGRGQRLWMVRPLAQSLASWAFDINISLGEAAKKDVLDIGCGFGDLLIYLKSRGCTVRGIDFDARAASAGSKHGVPIYVGKLADAGILSESVDVAILCHSLEHLSDPSETLGLIHRLLRPGGHVHIAVPNGNASGLTLEKGSWGSLVHPIHFWFFDEATLTRLLERRGFKVSSVRHATIWRGMSRNLLNS